MKIRKDLTRHLYSYSLIYFIAFLILALIAFWPGYYSRIGDPRMPGHIHWHGLSMTAWILLLVLQAALIRMKKFTWHTTAGKLSYPLVLLILITGFHIAHLTVSRMVSGTAQYYCNVALMFNSLVVFSIIYCAAIWFRSKPKIHARLMICTILPLLTPITDRLSYFYLKDMLSILPVLNGQPRVNIVGFGIATTILVVFTIMDWLSGEKQKTFLYVLCLMLIYEFSVLYFYKFEFWQKSSEAIMSLPLS